MKKYGPDRGKIQKISNATEKGYGMKYPKAKTKDMDYPVAKVKGIDYQKNNKSY